MKIKNVIIKNFRRYNNEVLIPITDLTVFVGKNDIGKTSVLEALDIFFNGSKAVNKISIEDLNIEAKNKDDKEITIGIEFCDLPSELILDSTYKTTLKDEYLLNENNNLLVIKKFKGETLRENVFIRANHPSNPECTDLLSKKNSDLKKIVQDKKINCDNMSSNSELRKSIWNFYKQSLNIQQIDIDVTKEDSKTIWSELVKKLPVYSLFTSDRKNEEGDSEIQDPLKETVKKILTDSEVIEKLNEVSEKVKTELQRVSDDTLRKLKEINPSFGNELHPNIGDTLNLKWGDVFKNVSIAGDNDIPLNKRGSGFRRLVLLSFFAAEAERKDYENSNGVIYAFEEPETSQHSSNQKLLMDSFKELSQKKGKQVLLTTHSPVIVKTLSETGSTRPRYENVVVLREVNGIFSIAQLDVAMLPFPSVNEVVYLAFDKVSEEYHDELYGFLSDLEEIKGDCPKNDTDKYASNSGIRFKTYKKDATSNMNISLTKYIRNQIHHPENTLNPRYSYEELKESVDCMRKYICNNHLVKTNTQNTDSQR